MPSNRLAIIGAGGHGKVAADVARCMNRFEDIVFLDGSIPAGTDVLDIPVVGDDSRAEALASEGYRFFVAIGNNAVRQTVMTKLTDKGLALDTLVHPSACIAATVTLGQGVLVVANSAINPDTVIGQGAIINTGATVDHDCNVGDFCHVAPGSHLAGTVTIGNGTFLGIGSRVIPGITIGEKSIIGAGSTVLEDIPSGVTAVGSPAKIIKR